MRSVVMGKVLNAVEATAIEAEETTISNKTVAKREVSSMVREEARANAGTKTASNGDPRLPQPQPATRVHKSLGP